MMPQFYAAMQRIIGVRELAFEKSVVCFRKVGLRYQGGADVLRDISFALAPGTLTFITGPSGAGKTTLLRLCHGRENPTGGEVILFGCDVRKSGRDIVDGLRRRIGLVLEGCRLMDHLSTFDNVALPLRIAGYRRSDYAKDVQELVNWVGLGGRMHDSAALLSAGERHRVAIARAVVGKPDLLLADDPTAALDDEAADRVMRLLLNIRRFGTTVVIATSHRNLANDSGATELRLSGGTLLDTRAAA